MVGQGFHRVDQRHKSHAAICRTCAASPARRSWFLRLAIAGNQREPGRAGAQLRDCWLLLLPLLVPRETVVATSFRGSARKWFAGFSVLPVLGERELDTRLGRRRAPYARGAGVQRRRPPRT